VAAEKTGTAGDNHFFVFPKRHFHLLFLPKVLDDFLSGRRETTNKIRNPSAVFKHIFSTSQLSRMQQEEYSNTKVWCGGMQTN
jgi:hypothetical protein